ncbi:hypothetical protein [Yinghuangia seranimata]|uniref:hypothetical protein n=1 Tax=Yinghuangia seranimata TaxID=408067 RepID=UPI00248B3257|nr:hypothetical protein [Yinghuangia seranimata]MDI2124768.1 hypothetical protein [Yinghuangia seranimata]
MDVAAVFLLARTRTVGERFVIDPGGDAEHDLRRAVSRGGGREFPADPRYRVVSYGPDRHAVYREFEVTAAELGVPGPVLDEHGRTILAIEGLAVTGDPFSSTAAELAAAHQQVIGRYAELWRTEAESRPHPALPRPHPTPPPRPTTPPPRPPAPKTAPERRARPVWIWIVPLGLLLAALLTVIVLLATLS